MITANERRCSLLQILSVQRNASANDLAAEFHVTRKTILRDIEILSCSAPIFTIKGKGGGIRVADGWYLSSHYLTDKQEALLNR